MGQLVYCTGNLPSLPLYGLSLHTLYLVPCLYTRALLYTPLRALCTQQNAAILTSLCTTCPTSTMFPDLPLPPTFSHLLPPFFCLLPIPPSLLALNIFFVSGQDRTWHVLPCQCWFVVVGGKNIYNDGGALRPSACLLPTARVYHRRAFYTDRILRIHRMVLVRRRQSFFFRPHTPPPRAGVTPFCARARGREQRAHAHAHARRGWRS